MGLLMPQVDTARSSAQEVSEVAQVTVATHVFLRRCDGVRLNQLSRVFCCELYLRRGGFPRMVEGASRLVSAMMCG